MNCTFYKLFLNFHASSVNFTGFPGHCRFAAAVLDGQAAAFEVNGDASGFTEAVFHRRCSRARTRTAGAGRNNVVDQTFAACVPA